MHTRRLYCKVLLKWIALFQRVINFSWLRSEARCLGDADRRPHGSPKAKANDSDGNRGRRQLHHVSPIMA